MGAIISNSLIAPAILIGIAAFFMPRLIAVGLPEGVMTLFLNALLSTIALFVVSAGFFFCLYLWQGFDTTESDWVTNVVFFGRFGLSSALIWAPIMVLSVAGLPRKWVKEVW